MKRHVSWQLPGWGRVGSTVMVGTMGIALLSPPSAAADTAALVGDYGSSGLLQTPTARMGTDGSFYGGFSYASPYSRYFITFQVLPWLEATLRYTSISNRRYGPVEFSGEQSYKDKAADVKIRLLDEGIYRPSIVLGFRDLGGTGLFQTEYLVANKQLGDFDVSLGVGWGYLANRGIVKNPFGLVADSYKRRDAGFGLGGTLNNNFFKGENIGLFGGVSYQTPIKGLSLQVEYDSNNYQSEPQSNRFAVSSPVNASVVYRRADWLQASVGIERGNTLMLRLVGTTNFNQDSKFPKYDPPPFPLLGPRPPLAVEPVQPVSPAPGGGEEKPSGTALDRGADITSAVKAAASLYGLKIGDVVVTGDRVTIQVADGREWLGTEIPGSLARQVAQAAPQVREVTVKGRDRDGLTAEITFDSQILRNDSQTRQQQADRPSGAAAGPPKQSRELPQSVIDPIAKALAEQGATLHALSVDGQTARAYVSQRRYRQIGQAFGRVGRVLSGLLPGNVERIEIIFLERSFEVISITFQREKLEKAARRDGSGSVEELWASSEIATPTSDWSTADYVVPNQYPIYNWNLAPRLRQTLGRPEAFVLYQLWARLDGEVQPLPGLTFNAGLGVNIYNNFNKLREGSDSKLPRVRSDVKEYLREGTTALVNLQGEYAFNVAPNTWGRVYGGLLEEMFGGVGGEFLYRPVNSDWAISADINWVKQRDYDQWFSFRDYQTITGHVVGYYRIDALGLNTSLRVGRYLARDWGATVDVSRTFDSGVTVGAFATKTNVSAERFGEGSFDKGIYLTIPLDQIFVRYSRGDMAWVYRPLTRDGGQVLSTRRPLISTTVGADGSELKRTWRNVLD